MFFWHSPVDQEAVKTCIDRVLAETPFNLETISIKGRSVLAILTCSDSPPPAQASEVTRMLEWDLAGLRGVKSARVILTAARTPQEKKDKGRESRSDGYDLAIGVKHIIAVASGKGGVGKSTVATNLAVALAQSGVKTGLLDADIYGPSIPLMMGQKEVKPVTGDNKKLIPVSAHGVACFSIGFLVDPESPMIWRGPMVQGAIVQMLRDVEWSGLDVLVIDLPPGTGDAQLTLAQKIKLSGAIIVSTPQDVALIDARKGLEMFRKVGVPILGMVQNMGLYCCPNCGHQSGIFGENGVADVARKLDVPLLADIPIDPRVREQGDAGTPITACTPDHPVSGIHQDLARKVIERLGQDGGKL